MRLHTLVVAHHINTLLGYYSRLVGVSTFTPTTQVGSFEKPTISQTVISQDRNQQAVSYGAHHSVQITQHRCGTKHTTDVSPEKSQFSIVNRRAILHSRINQIINIVTSKNTILTHSVRCRPHHSTPYRILIQRATITLSVAQTSHLCCVMVDNRQAQKNSPTVVQFHRVPLWLDIP